MNNTNIVAFARGKVMSRSIDKDGYVSLNFNVMPDIKDVKVIENNATKIVKVIFADNESEKAVLSEDDVYSLEQGVSICITKKLLSETTGGSGSAVYNKIIKHAIKVMDENKKQTEKMKVEEELSKARRDKIAKKKAARKVKREATMREEAIAIQTEAYLRAMQQYNNGVGV